MNEHYQPRNLQRIAKNLSSEIEEELLKAGFFYRIYSRCKSSESLIHKLNNNNKNGSVKYDGENKFLRDIIGIRVNLYFVDDQEILIKYFKQRFRAFFLEETVDIQTTTEFQPSRVNLIFRLPPDSKTEFREIVGDKRVDNSFELQLRTVFSEGWHEVDHDLRYKCPSNWDQHKNLERTFNGILAALETHEWSIIKIFDNLCYSHYKSGNISAMLRTKLRIRTDDYSISEELLPVLLEDSTFSKDLFKLDRATILEHILLNKINIPLKLDNIIYYLNYFFIRNIHLTSITPPLFIEEFKRNV